MVITHLYRALLALAVTLTLTGCATAPASHASADSTQCISGARATTGAACATVQVRAAR